jgi:cobalt-zinc-cadmium resistance protein CzcA
MIETVIRRAFRLRWLVLLCAVVVAVAGVIAFRYSKIEAYPDISGTTVTIITTYPGRSAEDVERQVTAPLELAMGNCPQVETIRSRTIFGLSVIVLDFEDGTELYWARQRVQERLDGLTTLPKNVQPTLSPPISSAGEILRYEVRGDGTLSSMELRTLHDWVITPKLLRVPGVGDVANFGGDAKYFVVTVRPVQLQRFGVSLSDLVDAVSKNNSTSGGSVVERGAMSFVVRGRGAVKDEREIGRIFVKSMGGTPVYLSDLASVQAEPKVPTGTFGKDDRNHTIEGLITLRKGENPSVVLAKLKAAIAELNHGGLPQGARLDIFYDRSELIHTTLMTVGESVGLGIGLVVLVLLFFLGSPRMAGIVALTIPFSLLFALGLMYATGIPVGLLSIGAIDFGIIVDGAVIVAEHIAHRMGGLPRGASGRDVRRTILSSVLEVQRPVFFSVLMIIAVHLPLLTLQRIEGLLFRPMAITIVFALTGSLLFALLVVPALVGLLFPRGGREWVNPLLRVFRPVYGWIVEQLLSVRWLVGPLAIIALAGIVAWLAPRMGTEFLPYMDEGNITLKANFSEGQSLTQTAEYADRIRHICLEFPDIAFATSRSGRTDSGLDPFPASRLEMMIGPKPRKDWTQFRTKHELIAALGDRLRTEFPTTRFNFTQPIIDNVVEETNGTSAQLAVEITGSDPAILQQLGQQTVEILQDVPGSVDVAIEQEGPQPQLVIEPDRALCARYNVRIEDVNTLVNTALGGDPVANLYEGERLFDIAVKFDRQVLKSPSVVAQLPVFTSDGVPVPLGQVAKVYLRDGQTMIAREGGRRRITVRCDIVGRDQGGFVAEAQRRFAEEVEPHLPADSKVNWIGMFENLARAKEHFAFVAPITVAILVVLLIVTLGSVRAALSVLMGLPFAFVGGAIGIYVRGMNVNVSVMVGFAALIGVATMDGVLMVQRITALRIDGLAMDSAIVRAAQERMRPIVMTSVVAVLGLTPAALATGIGSDVQRPLATVIVCGIFCAAALTLFLVPVFYRLLAPPLPGRSVTDDDLDSVAPGELVN